MNRVKQGKTWVVTIDGPAASGKTSVSRLVAESFGWSWVSTGAFYRGLAYVALREGIDMTSAQELAVLSAAALWEVKMTAQQTEVWYRGSNVTQLIGDEQVGHYASQISQYPAVREALLAGQRSCAQAGLSLVAEGRDCGTVVFPEADLKVYLTAHSANRAERRALEQGTDVAETRRLQLVRDQRDSSRQASPLQIPENALVIDTSAMRLEEVVEQVVARIHQQLGVRNERD